MLKKIIEHHKNSFSPPSFGKKTISAVLLLLLLSCFTACVSTRGAGDNCLVTRAAFDIGSQTTKMKVAEVDRCLQRKINLIHKSEKKVSYAENHRRGVFTSQIREEGINALESLKREAVACKADYFAGVATESFRQVGDSADYFQKVKDKTGIPVKIITQDEEALLGYLAAVAAYEPKTKKVLVWDIGGASMQITFRRDDKKFIVYRGKTASVSFKNEILTQIMQKNNSSPNPIGKKNLDRAVKLAADLAGDVPEEIKKIAADPETEVLGIGGVHNESIKKQLKAGNLYTRDELALAINDRIELNDREIGGQYAATEISNLIMVSGFMEKLGVEKVITVDVNLTDGILINPEYW